MAKPPSFAELIDEAQSTPSRSGTGDLASPFPSRDSVARLLKDRDQDKIVGMAEYEYEPHNKVLNLGNDADAEVYNEVIRLTLAGKAIIRTEEGTFTKEGDRLLALVWLTMKPNRKKIDARLKAEDDDEREELLAPRR